MVSDSLARSQPVLSNRRRILEDVSFLGYGLLKARKLGSYKIERLVRTGEFAEGASPLEQ